MRLPLLLLVLSAEPAAPTAETETPQQKALRELAGFQTLKFRATEATVKKAFPGGKRTEDGAMVTWSVKQKVAQLDAIVQFEIDKAEGLVSVGVGFFDAQKGYANTEQINDAVAKALAEKYGDAYSDTELALGGRRTSWLGAITGVVLDLDPHRIFGTKSQLWYTYRKFHEAKKAVKSDEL